MGPWPGKATPIRFLPLVVLLLCGVAALAACTAVSAPRQLQPDHAATVPSASSTTGGSTGGSTAPTVATTMTVHIAVPGTAPLPGPAALVPFPGTPAFPGLGTWQPAGRLVGGKPAVYQTLLVPPGDTKRAGIAWMDTSQLSARLYSGSLSPGGALLYVVGPAAPSNGVQLTNTARGPATFFDPHYNRDFITMSARPASGSR